MSGIDTISSEHKVEPRYQVPRKERSKSVDHSQWLPQQQKQTRSLNHHQHSVDGVAPTSTRPNTNEINFMDLKIIVPSGSDIQLDANQLVLKVKTSQCSCVIEGGTQERSFNGNSYEKKQSNYVTMHSAVAEWSERRGDYQKSRSMSLNAGSPNIERQRYILEEESTDETERSRFGSGGSASKKPVKPARRKSGCVNTFCQPSFLFNNNDNKSSMLDKKKSQSLANILTQNTSL